MKRVLLVATVASHIRAFHIPFINLLRERGYQVEVACRMDVPLEDVPGVWEIPFARSPYSPENMRAVVKLARLLRERSYTLIHVHTPVAAFLTRLVASRLGIPVMYTAHGFHFYRGAPLKNHLVYGTMERLAARWTASLIVMNGEDLEAARSFGLVEGQNLFYVHGVGVDLNRYGDPHARSIKPDLGIPEDSPVALCVAEMIPRKNHIQLLRAWRMVIDQVADAHLLLAGTGELRARLERTTADLGLSHAVHFLGFRTDVPNLLATADVLTLTSKHEGLTRCIMEAMVAGKPVVVTNVRGNRDLVKDGANGILVPLGDPRPLADALIIVLTDPMLRTRMGEVGREMVRTYSLDRVLGEMWDIYRRYLEG